ncbi:MAG: UvrD-helicase domain-containing protein [Puniceicoccales bacterium]|jgi:ATP-dependent exoDNAse (exonuclease V) beta subunit|nr:UvrD-helicase domain-containing protein [Puniceicoccales bacterium]
MKTILADEAERLRFIHELDRNFSVIAPAGVGKTSAIASRVVSWLRRRAAEMASPLRDKEDSLPFLGGEDFLPSRDEADALFVVSYTEKAAGELEQRVWKILRESPSGLESDFSEPLSSVFFGTIHGLAHQFLRSYGLALGLSPAFRILREAEKPSFWRHFLGETPALFQTIPPDFLEKIQSDFPLWDVLFLVPEAPLLRENSLFLRRTSAEPKDEMPLPPPPILNLEAALQFRAGGQGAAQVTRLQRQLKDWVDGEKGASLPKLETNHGPFLALLLPEMKKYWRWSDRILRALLAEVQEQYLQYRIREGRLFYEDLIRLAHRCLGDGSLAQEIPHHRVILDEAQDTDFHQFEWLLSLASARRRPWNFPAAGYFCMVGDPQQSIYAERAALSTYLELHRQLVEEHGAEALTFSVTLRCPQTLVDFVNAQFPKILTGREGQAAFVPLRARPDATQGHVYRWVIASDSIPEKPSADSAPGKSSVDGIPEEPAHQEARRIAEAFRRRSAADFGIERWSDIAFLCPRKKWLNELAQAFQGLSDTPACQLHSQETTYRDRPFYAWMGALLKISLEPGNDFELSGILREIFGISDARIARHFALREEDREIRQIREDFQKNSAEILACSPVQALEYLQERHRVAERLEAIFGRSFWPDYEALRGRAREASCRSLTLDEWGSELAALLDESETAVAVIPDALQFFSFHKAKGLEWPVVIIPFLYRGKREPAPRYPRWISSQEGSHVIFDRQQLPEFAEEIGLRQTQNEERLLYVALTRAKQYCLLVDDASLFPKGSGKMAQILFREKVASSRLWENWDMGNLPQA